jgi:16S rRNA (adenine1518-N6/adenine1519-N6)-dimethyltransferase
MEAPTRKRFGQNFLHDRGIVGQILATVAPQPGERLVEIGPGRGALTPGLLAAAGRMDAVELDRDLIAPLRALCAGIGTLALHQADALRFDFCALAGPGERLRLVGNLPYNISTPLLFHLLDQADCIQDMHFMLQREVVERMAAGPGSKVYGRLSLMLQTRCQVTPLFQVGPGAFRPAPQVDSAFVRLVPYREPPFPIRDPALFAALVAQAFSQRRKTLARSLRERVPAELIQACGIDPRARPEELSIASFVALANAVTEMAPEHVLGAAPGA